MRDLWFASLAVMSLVAARAAAQPSFVDITPAENPYFVTPETDDFWISAVAPADVDGDGDLDLAVLGYYVVYNQSVEDRLVLLLNEGPGVGGAWQLTPRLVPLGGLTAGASDLAWGDFDRDGDYDLVVGSDGATVLFRNTAGVLSPLALALPGYWEDSTYLGAYDLRSITWADFDNDGDLDLLVPSVWDAGTSSYGTRLLRNDGADGAGGWTFNEAAVTLEGTTHAQSAWADDDGDGDLDLLLTNVDPYLDSGFVQRYRNDGGSFSAQNLLGIRVDSGLADWGDYDADGDLDVLVAGNIVDAGGTASTVLRVYRQDGGSFSESTLIDAPNADWLDIHAATWADYDSDGDVDLLVTGNRVGESEIVGHSEIFANSGGQFTALGVGLPAPISSIGSGGAFTWFDVDGDGDLDYLVAGAYYVPGGNGLVESRMQLFRNGAPAANLAPGMPGSATATFTGEGLLFSWLPAADDHTATTALTYELELRPLGAPVPTTGRLPEPGNLDTTIGWRIDGLAPGTWSWSMRAVDSSFTAGARAAGTLVVPAVGRVFRDSFESGGLVAWSRRSP